MKKCRKKKMLRGGFSVEISLLMPLLFLLTLWMMFFLLYLYDMCIIKSAVTRGTQQSFYYINESNRLIEQNCAQTILKDLEDHLICVRDVEVLVEVSAGKVEGEVTGRLNVPDLFLWESVGGEAFWKLHADWNVGKVNPAQIILSANQLKEFYDSISQEKKREGESYAGNI